MKKIFIGGDSWARGEHPKFEHMGLEEYFAEAGHTVINASVLGASNHDSIDILADHMRDQYQTGDLVLWVQTDPLRDFRGPPPEFHRLIPGIQSAGGIYNLMQELLQNSYSKLDALGNKYATIIHAIGGLCSIGDTRLFRFISPTVVSWPQLLVGDISKYSNTDWSWFVIWCSDWTAQHLGIDPIVHDSQLAEKVIVEANELNKNRKIFLEKIFHPDGQHPNRDGHKILYNHLKERLKI